MKRKINKTIGIIPARFASTRFPGKPLIEINGKSMIQRVYEQAKKVSSLHEIYVATDDERIYNHVLSFGGKASMTNPNHKSGTDRCAEVLVQLKDQSIEYVVNIQGDEPFIAPQQIEQLVEIIQQNKDENSEEKPQIATLVKKIEKEEDLFNENIVKAVFGETLNAIYFSRNPIPFLRGEDKKEWLSKALYFKHIGLYAYKSEVLLELTQLLPSRLEKAESLEQLRWLENNFSIKVGVTTLETFGIDTPQDLERVR